MLPPREGMLNRTIKIAEKLALGLVVLLAAAALFALAVPSTVLNTGTLKYAVRRFGGDYRPSASDLSLRVTSRGLLTKRVVFSARDLCVDEVHGALTGCLLALEVDAVVGLGVRPLVSVRRLERLFVRAGELRWDATKAPAALEEPARVKPAKLVPAWASRMTLGAIDVQAPKALLVSTAGVTTAGLTASSRSGGAKRLTVEAYALRQGAGPAPGSRWDAELSFDSDLFRGKLVSQRGGATVNVLLLGRAAKPAVAFESVPRMPRDEIVALMLYDKHPGELDGGRKARAGGVADAMTSGAFGLAELYEFASTPEPAGADSGEPRAFGPRERGAITAFLRWIERY